METVSIAAPSAELRVSGVEGRLSVLVQGEAQTSVGRRRLDGPVEVRASLSTLRKLVEHKGDWWFDELQRRSDPLYVRRRLETLIARFDTLQGKRILDVGAGGGSSSLMLMDLGAAQVFGVEPDAGLVELARLRAADEGLAERATFLHVLDTSRLPLADDLVDVVIFNAVIEHIPPALRTAILQEAWRCLQPGGLLIICETPNRAFPFDGHTTHLPLVPWLPLPLAFALARAFSRSVARGQTRDDYIAQGLVGGSYWQLTRALPGAVCLNAAGGDAIWKTTFTSRRSAGTVRRLLIAVEAVLNRCGLPLNAFMPMLDLVFRKPSRA